MNSRRSIVVFLCFFMVFTGAYAMAAVQGKSIQLYAETWDMTRHGESILKVPVLVAIINEWQENTKSKIELRYPGGEEGELWVEELKDWLVSLGVPSSNIELVPGSDAQDENE